MRKQLSIYQIIAVCLLLTNCHFLWAQQKPSPIFIAPDAPSWMQLMVQDNPNVFEVERAFDDYYKTRKFEKTDYTQYFKRWMHWARQYVQPDGTIHIPTPAEQAEFENRLLQLHGQKPPQNGAQKLSDTWTFAGPNQTYDKDGVTVVTWQTNIYCVDIAPSNSNVLYAGGETGGIWKTTDKGLNWILLTKSVSHGSFGAIKIHPTDPNTVYAGTGGKIIKTTNGGATWTTVYTESGLWVNEIAIHATNPNIVMAAAEEGLLRTDNGGTSWTESFPEFSWAVKPKPDAPDTFFAIRDNGAGSDFMISTNGGITWAPSNTGWYVPTGDRTVTGAIIAPCPSNPNKLYAYLCGSGTDLYGYIGVFVSTNAGASWANTNPSNAIGAPYSVPTHSNLMASNGTTGLQQGFYDMAIVVNPANDQQLIAGGTSWYKSTDGGATWVGLGSYIGGVLSWSHPDIQCTVAQGSDLWIASDGGLNYSPDFGATHEARMNGISGADLWGFDSGWNEDILVGGRYHNGNMAFHQSFPEGKFYRMGGAEAPTGYVNPSTERKIYHSDIGGHRIKGGFTNGVTSFSTSIFPNESYAYYANSEMTWHPQCWSIVFLGNANILYKSTDGGSTFFPLYTFPGTTDYKVYEVDIARSNPQVMYCSQWDGTDDKIWRSADGGLTFTACTPLPLPNNNDRVKLSVSATDANTMWVAVTYGSNGKKVYKTTDGGANWVNLTTATLNSIKVQDILAQHGTNGGVYIGTNAGVFYRNNTHTDWQPYADGLPLSTECNRLKPFYRDGKLRNGTWGFGVWEAPLYEPSATIAQAMTDKLTTACARDTFYFDDYSVLNHTGASWNWSFPGAAFVANANTRTPKAVFGATGNYQAIMNLTTPAGTFADTLFLSITENLCAADTLPGKALSLDGSNYYASLPALNLNTNTFTVTAWIKANGTQNDWAGLVFCRGGNTTAGISLRNTNELRYHWNDTGYSWSSGLIVPDNEWTHIALAVSPTSVKIYKNGVAATNTTTVNIEEFNSNMQIGRDPNGGARYYKGLMDEVCIYNRTLSQNEIRELMHLTKKPETDISLLAYFQFNTDASGNTEYDKARGNHATLANGAFRTTSTGPFAGGVSYRTTASNGSIADSPAVGLRLKFNATSSPNGEIVLNRLNTLPDAVPACSSYLSDNRYWIVNNYGSNAAFTQPDSIKFYGLQVPPLANVAASGYNLFKRNFNADGNTWGSPLSNPVLVTEGTSGNFRFASGNNLTGMGQLFMTSNLTQQNIAGITETCINNTETYSVTPLEVPNATYNWVITSGNGTIVSGQGTPQIQVQWENGISGQISVSISY
ncbi:hypothetical protein C7N43_31550 [Sphingobacteriales bacterium UPWRP_1]|nr:hypothetical protein B6N25_15470 [Sphingobacteriales bacterium TSM_CSS]PSJ72959.1 hypothetical protein C7N43_31550 [Sphingobacteriales bacterium UPWRP_1]